MNNSIYGQVVSEASERRKSSNKSPELVDPTKLPKAPRKNDYLSREMAKALKSIMGGAVRSNVIKSKKVNGEAKEETVEGRAPDESCDHLLAGQGKEGDQCSMS